ncbi:dTDP-4-dehydrorhamnose reductase [Ensifer sp. ENS09]|uniref:dTDP-4-dehydrorhamnose reductase n=1 Tax=Ensifer sp. ENS09 TaxID=2769263 RepID=UPI0017839829|nr:dTDP-4-dehydrorhamnose reductase [Ensifer sp. ENS09]MBD9653012.1 dTDP-4-dehydrorhamnose reductase [Ensifer sp. ENS09]
MQVLVTGGSGQVGGEILRRGLGPNVEVVAPNRNELNLADFCELRRYVLLNRFAAVVNCGAYTAVDKAESDVSDAWTINALAPAVLASAAAERGIPIVQISTDYVFDGTKVGRYVEDDPTRPVNVYGNSKAAGEAAIRALAVRHVILRTAWIFSSHGSNFLRSMLRLSQTQDQVRIVNDQFGCPTSATDIAGAVAAIVTRFLEDRDACLGTYHFASAGEATWFDFASEIFRQRSTAGRRVPQVIPISTIEYPTPARRPQNSRLSTQKFEAEFSFQAMDWKDAIAGVLQELDEK